MANLSETSASIREFADQSTDDRSAAVEFLYAELEFQLRKFYQCRESSLATTNAQQSRLWWGEAVKAGREAYNTDPR